MLKDYLVAIVDRVLAEIRPATVLVIGFSGPELDSVLQTHTTGVDRFLLDAGTIAAVGEEDTLLSHHGEVYQLTGLCELAIIIDLSAGEVFAEVARHISKLRNHIGDFVVLSLPLAAEAPAIWMGQAPEQWGRLFAEHGLYRDFGFSDAPEVESQEASLLTLPWMARFRCQNALLSELVADYERGLWVLEQEARARHYLNWEYREDLVRLRARLEVIPLLQHDLDVWRQQTLEWQQRCWILEQRWWTLEQSMGWALLRRLQSVRAWVAPPGGLRDQFLEELSRISRQAKYSGIGEFCKRLFYEVGWFFRSALSQLKVLPYPPLHHQTVKISPVPVPPGLVTQHDLVDIVICVHNALEDVGRCLDSVILHSTKPFRLILVDDGSDTATRDYLLTFSQMHDNTLLLRNDAASGYTYAANQGLHVSTAAYVVLLNSDTVVTPQWLEGMISCADSDMRIGIVGPLSNTASWQSIPKLAEDGDWAHNSLPEDITVAQMGALVAQESARLYPRVPLLNGFCLLLKRSLINEIGYLDEVRFGAGYGEEDDYALRAGNAGWFLAIADDVYIYHAQSRSYSDERRKQLSQRALQMLVEKHGQSRVSSSVSFCEHNLVLEGIRARVQARFSRWTYLQQGRQHFGQRRVLFILPVNHPGGGANVVIYEAQALQKMSVKVAIFNLLEYKAAFEEIYPALNIPVIYGEPDTLPQLAQDYDAMIATFNVSVPWLSEVKMQNQTLIRAYYVQGYEPCIYPVGSAGYFAAQRSYGLFEDLVHFTKTEWTQQKVKAETGVDSAIIGVSADVDLFRPRPRRVPPMPLRIAAMIRPDSPYRSPRMTMELLRRASRRYGHKVEIVIFGTTLDNPLFAELPLDFAWNLVGVLNQYQVANLFSDMDVFVDFSTEQAMGLTALEAMACGVATIVPECGGAVSFAHHEQNSLVVDTASSWQCWRALCRLIEDEELRLRLRKAAVYEVVEHFPERAVFNMMKALFGEAAIDHDAL